MAANNPNPPNPNPPNPPNPNPVPPPPPVIRISPWQGPIDLSDKVGKSLWDEGTKPLEIKFTGYAKDVARFLAAFKTRVDKCDWMGILTFSQNRDLIHNYGEIEKDEVIQARDDRDLIVPTTLLQARPQIDALMMYHFLYDSLGITPQKKICTKLDEIQQDGPLLFKIVMNDTYVATLAATFTTQEKIYELNLKKYRWNVQAMNQDVREKSVDLTASGHGSNPGYTIIALFRAYYSSTNEEFRQAIGFWKQEYKTGVFKDPEELMQRADEKYEELKQMGTWGKRGKTDDQMVALPAETNNNNNGSDGKDDNDNNTRPPSNSRTPKWKLDHSLSKTNKFTKNGKTYYWCDGPGHAPMWVIHKPGTCTGPHRRNNNNRDNNNNNKTFFTKDACPEDTR